MKLLLKNAERGLISPYHGMVESKIDFVCSDGKANEYNLSMMGLENLLPISNKNLCDILDGNVEAEIEFTIKFFSKKEESIIVK